MSSHGPRDGGGPAFDYKTYFQNMMGGGSEPLISIFAVMHEDKFIVGFPTRDQAEGYLKADKRKLTIREGSFPAPPRANRALDTLRIGRLPPKLGPPVVRGPSPYMRDVMSKLGEAAVIDKEYDAAHQEYVFRNQDGLEVRVPRHTMMKEYS